MAWRRYSRRVIPAPARNRMIQLQVSQYEALLLPRSFLISSGDTVRVAMEATVQGANPADWRRITLPVSITARII
jgi:hypothetical protein